MIALTKNIEPEMCVYYDEQYSILIVEFVLQNIDKGRIRILVNSQRLLLFAIGQNVTYKKYLPLRIPITAHEARVVYEGDLLRIRLPVRA